MANVAMILFGWLQELVSPPGRTRMTMLSFQFGCVGGATEWVAIVVNLIGASGGGANEMPGFVYSIIASLFAFFMSFVQNQ